MNELSLFTGAGGGVLGTKLLGWTTLGYVEFNEYCQKVLSQRIRDGILDEAPIFTDIRAFISEGYAASYTGMVDVITAGFPCQPFSVAGKQQGENDPRNMWPQTIECIRIIRPQFALLENVPGLLAHPYARRIFGDLAESGYDARWRVLSAAEVGAPHKRDRIWIVAHSRLLGQKEHEEQATGVEQYGEIMANPEIWGLQKWIAKKTIQSNAKCRSLSGRGNCGEWWNIEPAVGRVAHGVASLLDFVKPSSEKEL